MSDVVQAMKVVRDYLKENPVPGYPSASKSVVFRLDSLLSAVEKEMLAAKRDAEIAEFSLEVQAAAERGWNRLRELNPKFDGVEFTSFGGLPHPKKLEHLRFAEAAGVWKMMGTLVSHDSGVIFSRPAEPRVIKRGELIPDDVRNIKTAKGEDLVRDTNGKFFRNIGAVRGWGGNDTNGPEWDAEDFPAEIVVRTKTALEVLG